MRCRGGRVDRIPSAESEKCNCNFHDSDGSLNKNCRSCNIYAGDIEMAEVKTSDNPKVLAAGIGKERFARFKSAAISGETAAWFKCFACRNSMLLYSGSCISAAECLSKSEELVVYSVNSYNGKCTPPFHCVKGVMSTTGKRCKCPRAMNGCSKCRYTKSWQHGDEVLSGPVCMGCPPGKLLLSYAVNYDTPDQAFRRGVGRCIKLSDCVESGRMPVNDQCEEAVDTATIGPENFYNSDRG